MRRTCMALAAVLILATLASGATLEPRDATRDELSVRVLESDARATVLQYELGSFLGETVDIDGEQFYKVSLGDEGQILRKGFPELPNVCRSIVIPDDAEMAVRVVSSHYSDIPDVDVAPSKGVITRNIDPATVAYTFGDVYDSDEWYPAELAYSREPYIMRDVRGLVVVVNPMQYNPATRTLRVYDSVTVEVSVVGPATSNPLTHRPATMNSEFKKIYENHFLNFDQAGGTRYPDVADAGNMLIVCYDDAGFLGAMQPLVDWKNQMGVPCEMVTVTAAGGTAANIKNYVTQYYSDNDLTYLLLVGDAAEVPTFTSSGGASDPTYSTISPDMYPELFVGRFSAATVAQVQTQVQRTIEYERIPQAGGNWYHKGMGVASNQGPGDDGEYDDEHADNIRDDLLGFTYTIVDQIYDYTGTASDVTSGLNNGRSVINYTGHGSTTSWGSTGFSNTHVNALVNDNMLPFIISVACVNGQFTYSTCFGEAWLRATNGVEPTGAIGAYMSSINQSWNPPMDAQDEITDLLVGTSSTGTRRTFGGLCYNGCGHMMDVYGVDGEDMFLTWHIFGDPSVRVRTNTPAPLTVSHSANVDPFASTFEVTVDGVQGALVALSHNGVLYGSGLTAVGGIATVDILQPLPEYEDITVTVTSFNTMTYEGTAYSGGAYVPMISVAPLSFDESLAPNETSSDTLTIDNVGDPLSTLHYDIEVVASGARSAHGRAPVREADPFGNETRAWVQLLTPNGGESLPYGEVFDITWDSGGSVGFIKLEYSGDSGTTWTTIAAGTANDGVYEWTVDVSPSDLGVVRASKSADAGIYDISDWVFSVVQIIEWVSVAPASGDVSVGSRAAIEILFDATGLTDGDYYADVIITSNGGDPVIVPVALHVSATGVDGEFGTPSAYAIKGVSPNPFNPVTTVTFGVPSESEVRLAVYDVTGRFVRTLVDGGVEAGYRTVVWDGRDEAGREVGSGVYFCRMEAEGFGDAVKMVLLK